MSGLSGALQINAVLSFTTIQCQLIDFAVQQGSGPEFSCTTLNMLKKNLNYTLSVSELNSCWMQIHVSDAPWGQANQNCWNLEKRKVYRRAKPGEWVAHAQKVQTPWWFSRKSFIGKIFRDGCRACEFFWLVGPEVTEWDFRNTNPSAHPVWGLSMWLPSSTK